MPYDFSSLNKHDPEHEDMYDLSRYSHDLDDDIKITWWVLTAACVAVVAGVVALIAMAVAG